MDAFVNGFFAAFQAVIDAAVVVGNDSVITLALLMVPTTLLRGRLRAALPLHRLYRIVRRRLFLVLCRRRRIHP